MNDETLTIKEWYTSYRTTFPDAHSALLPLLHRIHEQWGYLSREHLLAVSEVTGLPETEVASVVSFYTLFRREKPGVYHLQVCTNLSCAARGANAGLRYLQDKLGILPGQTTEDGFFSLESVQCLAACDIAPMLQINLRNVGPYTEESLAELIEQLRQTSPEDQEQLVKLGLDIGRGVSK